MKKELEKIENIEKRKISFGEKLSLKLRKGIIGNKLKTILLILIVICAFIAINMWAEKNNLHQIDLTENKHYTLSQTSKDIIKDINKEVTIYIYGYDENTTYVNFLKQYNACNPNIKYEIVTETTHYDIITEYNMGYYDPYSYNILNKNEIVVVSDIADVSLSVYDFETAEYVNGVVQNIDVTEELLTNAIIKVTDEDPSKIYFVSGHGEFSEDEISQLLDYLKLSVYEYEFINLFSATEIPADCDILAILGPTADYTIGEAEAIKKYINNGGNIMAAIVTFDREGQFPNLQSILDLYAVTIQDCMLYDTNPSNYYAISNQAAPMVLLPNYSSVTEITNKIEYASIFSMVQAININYDKIEELKVTPQELLFTSTKTYNILDYKGFNGEINLDNLTPDVYIFGRILTKTIPSVEEGIPAKESKLIIVGNDTFLADYDTLIRDYPISYNGNMEFTMNCFKYLSNKENTLEIHKNIEISTFTATAKQDNVVKFIVFSLPIIIILIGIVIAFIRKRMR